MTNTDGLERSSPERKKRLMALTAAVGAFYLFYLFAPINIYLYQSVWNSYYLLAVPVTAAGVVYWFRRKELPEYRLLLAYFLWFVLSRIINRDYVLNVEFNLVLDLLLLFPMFALGLSLSREAQEKFLRSMTVVLGIWYFAVGLLSIAAFVLQRDFPNPISGQYFVSLSHEAAFARVNILDMNANATAFWFLGAILLLTYQFFRCEKKLWRLPIVLCVLVDCGAIAVTYTRSVYLSLSFAMGLLAVILLFEKLKGKKTAVLAPVLAVAFAVTAFAVYQGIYLLTDTLGHAAVSVAYEQGLTESGLFASETDETAEAVEDGDSEPNPAGTTETPDPEAEKERAFQENFADPRRTMERGITGYSSGRINVYKATLDVIRTHPILLLRGCLYDDSANLLTEAMKEYGGSKSGKFIPHYQNFVIQVLIVTGVPGFLLIAAFCILMTVKGVRFLFSRREGTDIASKTLVLPVAAGLLYGLFESCYFATTDLRSLYFYLMCGFFLGRICEVERV